MAWWGRDDDDYSLSPKSRRTNTEADFQVSFREWNSSTLLFLGVVLGGALLIAVVCAPRLGASSGYALTHSMVGEKFFTHWSFFDGPDPTHGVVEFVTFEEADRRGMVSAAFDRVFIGTEATEVLSGTQGRKSVRIESNEWFEDGLFILDVDHAPIACGAWPAFWMYGEDSQHAWPRWGEYDILEAVHNQTFATTTLHTRNNCDQAEVNKDLDFKGNWVNGQWGQEAKNCFIQAKGEFENQGCGQKQPAGSWGRHLNQAGGGTWVAEWDPQNRDIRTWFFQRGEEPADLLSKKPRPETWGVPTSFFTLRSKFCSPEHFKRMRLVFDITFCGDYGTPTMKTNCPYAGNCDAYVRNNPHVFSEAFWSIRALDVYRRPQERHGVISAPLGAYYEVLGEQEGSGWIFFGLIFTVLGLTGCVTVFYILSQKAADDNKSLIDTQIDGLSTCAVKMEDLKQMELVVPDQIQSCTDVNLESLREGEVQLRSRLFGDGYERVSQGAGRAGAQSRGEALAYPQRGQASQSQQGGLLGGGGLFSVFRANPSSENLGQSPTRSPQGANYPMRTNPQPQSAWSWWGAPSQPVQSQPSVTGRTISSSSSQQPVCFWPQGQAGQLARAQTPPMGPGWNRAASPAHSRSPSQQGWSLPPTIQAIGQGFQRSWPMGT
mmetsp:Transcript_25405/g.60515  ORF Transcript_25405/g.60515 Transcript_25405/m.60515 type:complete len:660 (-) Transcript_25405:77-2056(-)